MNTILRCLPLASLLFASTAIADGEGTSAKSTAHSGKAEADKCLRDKIWEGYSEGWAVRTATNPVLGKGESKIYLVTLYAGNKYKFLVCGDTKTKDIDLALHDSTGAVRVHDSTDSPDPVVEFMPIQRIPLHRCLCARHRGYEDGMSSRDGGNVSVGAEAAMPAPALHARFEEVWSSHAVSRSNDEKEHARIHPVGDTSIGTQ